MELKKGDRVLFRNTRGDNPFEVIVTESSAITESLFLGRRTDVKFSYTYNKDGIIRRLNSRYSQKELKELLILGARVVYNTRSKFRVSMLTAYDADSGWCSGEKGNTIYTFKDWAITAIFPAKPKLPEHTLDSIRNAVQELIGFGVDGKIRSEVVALIEQYTPTAPTTLSNINPADYPDFMKAINKTRNKYRTVKEKHTADETIQMFDRVARNVVDWTSQSERFKVYRNAAKDAMRAATIGDTGKPEIFNPDDIYMAQYIKPLLNFEPFTGRIHSAFSTTNNTTKMDNRKPFDFEAWRKGAEIETRNGLKVTNLTYFPEASSGESLAGVIENKVRTWFKDGRFCSKDGSLSLVMSAPKLKWPCVMLTDADFF